MNKKLLVEDRNCLPPGTTSDTQQGSLTAGNKERLPSTAKRKSAGDAVIVASTKLQRFTAQGMTSAEDAGPGTNARRWERLSGKEAQPKSMGSAESGSESQEATSQGQDPGITSATQPTASQFAQGRVLRTEHRVELPRLGPVEYISCIHYEVYGRNLFPCS